MSSGAPAAVQPVPRGGLGRMVGRRITDWLPAAVVLVATFALWQGLIVWLDVQEFLLPKPTSIATTFWDDKSELWHAGWYTFQEALGCFFPVLVNTLKGLTSVRPQDLELMRSYAAGEVEIFRRVRIPTALPFMFTG